jgi:6-pyruvoyltetrahydropterin/6-carboxytetrahydropterin synthase
MIFLTKKAQFSAAHRLYNPNFSDEKNDLIFGLCNNKNGHGHNYYLEVTVKGKINADTGFLIDLKRLKQVMNDEIIAKVDHKHLNYDVPFLNGVIPTVENLVKVFWDILDNKISEAKLHCIKLYETETSFVEYYGD